MSKLLVVAPLMVRELVGMLDVGSVGRIQLRSVMWTVDFTVSRVVGVSSKGRTLHDTSFHHLFPCSAAVVGAARRSATATEVSLCKDVCFLWLTTQLWAAANVGPRWATRSFRLPHVEEAGAETYTVPETERRSSVANGRRGEQCTHPVSRSPSPGPRTQVQNHESSPVNPRVGQHHRSRHEARGLHKIHPFRFLLLFQ